MKQEPNFFDEIISRRIPQIIGMYIAAVWLAMEIADWMSERFSVSDSLSIYVFVSMLSILPSVIFIAWGHGRPGKDNWVKKEVIWLSLNLVLAFFIVKQVVTPDEKATLLEQSQAPKKVTIIDTKPFDTNNTSSINETDKPNNHQTVISYFWDNQSDDSSLHWLQYGAAWLVSQDLNRTPVLSVNTPYDSDDILSGLISKGFKHATAVPLSLALKLANTSSARWMILGSFSKTNNTINFNAKIIDVLTGSEIESISEGNQNPLVALNRISKRISSLIYDFMPKSANIIPDLAIAEHTSNNLKAIQYLIDAKNHVAFNNDFTAGVESLKQALAEDNSFAEANVLAANYYRAKGDIPQAVEQSKQALKLDYKVYQEKVFALKANIFGMTGDSNKAMQVLENWVKFYPSSAVGLATLGRNYLISNQLDSAEGIYQQLANIDNGEHDSLLSLGQIYRLQNNQQQALKVLKQFLEANPKNINAYIELADAYKQFMMLDEAKELYQQASILGSENFDAEIGIASVTAYEGDYVSAFSQLYSLLEQSETNKHKYQIQESIKLLYIQTGQINKALEVLELQKKSGKEALDPLSYSFNINGGEIELLVLTGEFEKAISQVEKLKSETKPPFNQIASAFYLIIYEAMEDFDNYEKELLKFDAFLNTFSMPYYEKIVLAWKAKLATEKQQYELADLNYNQAIKFAKESFVRLETIEVVGQLSYSKAESLFQQNRIKETLTELDLILKYNPLFARAHYLKAKCHLEMGNKLKAKNEINKAKRIWQFADETFTNKVKLIQLESESL